MWSRLRRSLLTWSPVVLATSILTFAVISHAQTTVPGVPGPAEQAAGVSAQRAFLDQYCVTCHNERLLERGTVPVAFEDLDTENVGVHADVWEEVVRKLRLGMMPPVGRPRPDQETYGTFLAWLETELDRAAAASPNPGRPVVRRLTEAEYINAIKSLLAIEVDGRTLLFPADDVDEQGFSTNGDVLSISPALFERYLTAANRISRMAVGDTNIGPGFAAATYETPRLLYQDDQMTEDLPFGSRGGLAIRHYFPVGGEYELTVRLRRMVYDYIVGMREAQQLDVRLDGVLLERFTVGDAERYGYPSAYTFFGTIRGDPEWEEYVSKGADAHLNLRFQAPAGLHVVGITFANARTEPTGVLERRLSGFSLSGRGFYHDNAAVARVDIVGPHSVSSSGDTPSRRTVFTCQPAVPADEEPCARQIVSALARRAYRRPSSADDVETLMGFYETGRNERGFEAGIQKAIERLLVSPEFLFRVEEDRTDIAPGTAYRLTDLELATRLSLFLWSDIPDDELLTLAEAGQLRDPGVLEAQVRRMLADDRSGALVDNFASQWLQLNRLQGVMPDADVFYEFDENLRADMARETSLFLESQVREDRGLLDLLTADYTYVNERLARHYGISGVYGERYRRVTLDDANRGGLLGHASLLTVTSYPTRTSPVLRGKWLLDNILGMPPPPPPAEVPALAENDGGSDLLSLRERTEQHRRNPACAVCHRIMDPPGFALEHFDAVGRWRIADEDGIPVDAAGVLGDGTHVDGPAALREVLSAYPESYVRTVTEKLLTYALGRRIEYYDQPVIRAITSTAARDDYRWSSVILEVVKSMPFQMRRSES